MKVVIIKYNSGNVTSVRFALQRLGIDAILSNDHDEILTADRIIFPGVGHAATAMESLKQDGLHLLLPKLTQPFLGICAGMQLMCAHSEEGDSDCLDIVPMKVKRFPVVSGLKVPHTGWNTVHQLKGELFKGIPEDAYMYFVHSYYVEYGGETVARCNYGLEYSAAIQKDNFYGVQFHAELSSSAGSTLLSNFLNIQ